MPRRIITPRGPSLSRRSLLVATGATLATPTIVRAQGGAAWPNRPIRVILPYGVGGATDIHMRLIAPKLSEILGQPVVVENRVGSGGVVGSNMVARSAPDGYTLLCAAISAVSLAPHLYKDLPYNPFTDLTAITPTIYVPLTLAITKVGWNVSTAAQLIEIMKANPGKYHFGSNGVGTTSHLAGANFVQSNGIQAVHVPYRGGAQVYAALISGEIQFSHEVAGTLKPMHEAGTIRCLFVASEKRSPVLPDVPSMTEAGLPPYRAYSWFGLFGPAGMDRAVVTRIAQATDQAMMHPDIRPRLEGMDGTLMRNYTPERFAQYVREEHDAWGPLIAASGARVE
ncbi:MAG: tripartite tricarboxylate transporter substrate binding protein [Alphaproteobacteria bacterium]|nr:tripartite tricarboxylate transporter substrate binding protein [Alphaproteobacteria bacterium]